jgi:hypothetical protein
MKALWSPAVWWPAWLALFTGLFLLREIWALAAGDTAGTLSDWVWRQLAIIKGETPAQWSAVDYLVFGAWVVLVSWLTFHFFFRKFS